MKHLVPLPPLPSKLRRTILLEILRHDLIPLCNRSRKRHVSIYASALRLLISIRLNLIRNGACMKLGILHDDFVTDFPRGRFLRSEA